MKKGLLQNSKSVPISGGDDHPSAINLNESKSSEGNNLLSLSLLNTTYNSGRSTEKRVFFKTSDDLSLESINAEAQNEFGNCDKSHTSIFSFRSTSPADCTEVRKMSLVGKPLVYKNYQSDVRFRKKQTDINNFLERPRGTLAVTYHLAVLIMVLFCLILSVFSTIPDYEVIASKILYYTELGFINWLIIEYVFRIWASGCRSRYRGFFGRLKFMMSTYCVIDIIVIMASVTVLILGASGQVFLASTVRGLRFFQILRMLRIDRRAGSFRLLWTVVTAHKQELLTAAYIGFLGLIFSSFLVYLLEKDSNERFSSFADALYFGLVTLSGVGYGDVIVETPGGKFVSSFICLLGVSFFALPAGILGSGFALKVQQHQRQKHIIRRRVPAATLIQCLWRHYSAAPESRSLATWKIYLQPVSIPQILVDGVHKKEKLKVRSISCRIQRTILNSLKRRRYSDTSNEAIEGSKCKDDKYPANYDDSVKPNNGMTMQNSILNKFRSSKKVNRNENSTGNGRSTSSDKCNQPTIRNLLVPKAHDNISMMSESELSEMGALGFSLGSWKSKTRTNPSHKRQHEETLMNHKMITTTQSMAADGNYVNNTRPHRSKSITDNDSNIASTSDAFQRRSFSCEDPSAEPLEKPRIENVLNDYTFMIAPMYNWLESLKDKQRNIDNSVYNGPGNNEDPLASLWGQFNACTSQPRQSVEYNIDDEVPSIRPKTMEEFTPALKNAIRAIRRIQLLVARRKIRQCLQPYDLKDVIEQQTASHVELQARVKQVQLRLDCIVGKQVSKEDLKMSIASRVLKVEKTVEKIDKKVDLLVEMFLEDRRIQLGGVTNRQEGRSPPHSALARFSGSPKPNYGRNLSHDFSLDQSYSSKVKQERSVSPGSKISLPTRTVNLNKSESLNKPNTYDFSKNNSTNKVTNSSPPAPISSESSNSNLNSANINRVTRIDLDNINADEAETLLN